MISGASTGVRWGAVAAVLVAGVALGGLFVSNRGGQPAVGSADSTAPPSVQVATTPSPSPTPAGPPALVNARRMPCENGVVDCLEPGSYRLSADIWPARITIDVPEGWWEWRPGDDFDGVLVDGGPEAPDGSGWRFG